jgi:FAD/FMN-containing dehydrogenase
MTEGTSAEAKAMTRVISRKAFLGGALGAIAAGALFAPARSSAVPGAQDWSGLAASLDGQLLLPSDGQWGAAKSVFNTRYAGSTPAAVIRVKSTADIQKAVAFAAANALKIVPRGGGHSYNGASTATGAMVLDLRQLPGGVSYDGGSGRVKVTPATGLYALHQALAAAGVTVATGTCPTVSTAGLALGGGLGADSRRAGLTCDALTSVSVVLPSGEAVTASADDHPDLFWALRGGGGGNFAVTTSMTFKTFSTSDTDVVHLFFPGAMASQVIAGWQVWLTAADRSTWALVDISTDSTGMQCGVLATCPSGAGPGVAAAITSAVGVQPTQTENPTFNHMDLVMYLAGGSSTSQPRGFVAGSDVMPTLTSAEADAIVAAVLAWPRAAGRASVIIDAIDGAVSDIDPGGTAFPWRRQSAILQWYVDTPNSGVASTASQWVAAAHQAVQPYSAGGYVNYLEANTTAARYFGGNLARLSTVRQKYDPGAMMFSGLSF